MRFLLIGIGLACTLSAKTSVPQDKIPAGISAEIRQEIERLYLTTTDVVQGAGKLAAMGEKAAPSIPFLIGLFGEGSGLECVREGDRQFCGFGLEMSAAAAALAQIGAPALPPLVVLARKGEKGSAEGAIMALARMENPRATAVLIELAGNRAYALRSTIAKELGSARSVPAADLLVRLAKDSDPAVRAGALEGIANSKDPRAADLVVAGLADADAKVREAAAFTLVNHPEPKAFDALVRTLSDPSDGARNGACQALGELKDKRAVKPLVGVVTGDKESLVRFQAGRALEAITGEHFGENGGKWQKWFDRSGQ